MTRKALYKHKKSGDLFAIETDEQGDIVSTSGPLLTKDLDPHELDYDNYWDPDIKSHLAEFQLLSKAEYEELLKKNRRLHSKRGPSNPSRRLARRIPLLSATATGVQRTCSEKVISVPTGLFPSQIVGLPVHQNRCTRTKLTRPAIFRRRLGQHLRHGLGFQNPRKRNQVLVHNSSQPVSHSDRLGREPDRCYRSRSAQKQEPEEVRGIKISVFVQIFNQAASKRGILDSSRRSW
jgi:hypothetical protein